MADPQTPPAPSMAVHFAGMLDGAPIESVRGEVAQAGSEPYLLLGLVGGWMLDVGGLSPQETRHRIRLVAPDDRQFSGTIAGRLAVDAGGQAQLRVPPTLLQTDGASPEAVLLLGVASWRPEAAVVAAGWQGNVTLRWQGQVHGPVRGALRPFNDGWRLAVVVPLAPGQTLSITVQLDTLDAPTTGSLQVFDAHPDAARMAGVASPLLRVVREGGALIVRVTALVDDADDVPQAFTLQFSAPASVT